MPEKMIVKATKDPNEAPTVEIHTGINNYCRNLGLHCQQPTATTMRAAVRAVSAARGHGTLGTAFTHVAANRLPDGWEAVGVVVAENTPVVASVRAALVECELQGGAGKLPDALQGTTDVEAMWTFHLLYVMVFGLARTDYLSSLPPD